MLKQLNRLRPLLSRRDKVLYACLFVMMLGGALLDVVGVGAIPAFVATLAVPERVMSYPAAARVLESLGITTGQQLVLWGCVGLIFVFLLKNVYLSFLHYAKLRLTEHHRVHLSTRLFAAYVRAPYEFQLNRNSAELMRNVTTETREIFTGIVNPALNTVMGGMLTIGIVLLLVASTPLIGLFGFLVVGGGSWSFMRLFKRRLETFGLEAKEERKENIKAVTQGLGALVDARVLGREEHFIKAFDRSMARFAYVDRLRQFIAQSGNPVLETVAVVGLLLVIIAFVVQGVDTVALVPTLALFGAAIMRLRASVSQVVSGVSQIQYSVAAISNVVDDLNLLERKPKKPAEGAKAKKEEARLSFEHELSLEGVSYTYPNASIPTLQDISLSIGKGSAVAFVGATGSGKTTLINVLLGLLQPQQGTVAADERDIFTNLQGWHKNIGYIPQTIFLLDDTIRQNIAFGLPEAEVDEEKLWQAVRAAQLEEFVLTLEKGLDTVVGERGVRLSGGQRQRVGLARALYHNPEVLIMDEATSALDNHTENLVMQALNDLKEGRTFIMIAHRLSTVRSCDTLYFLRDGRVEATGTYDELVDEHQDFRRMAEVA